MSSQKKKRLFHPLAVKLPLATILGWIAYSHLFISHDMPLPPAVPGEQHVFNGRLGRLNYYVAGTGNPPLLLIHSVNAAASSYEMRPIFERLREQRRVYSLDLPGFGFSDRSDRPYTPRLYTDAVLEMVKMIQQEHDSAGMPIDVMALSLGGEFVVRAITEEPEHFRTLALISPTAFYGNERRYGPTESTLANPTLYKTFTVPLWSRPFFDLLNTRPVQKWFLSKSFGSEATVDAGLAEYDYLTAHQPGAQHAPFAFVSGMLFSGDIDHLYDSLTLPVWVAHGNRGDFGAFSAQRATERGEHWHVQGFETGALPHFEQPEIFIDHYQTFLNQVARSSAL
jgi:pimeloyl-ACP methyl ester carboxylesterase